MKENLVHSVGFEPTTHRVLETPALPTELRVHLAHSNTFGGHLRIRTSVPCSLLTRYSSRCFPPFHLHVTALPTIIDRRRPQQRVPVLNKRHSSSISYKTWWAVMSYGTQLSLLYRPWWARKELNPRPLGCPSALTLSYSPLARGEGLEPSTPQLKTECSETPTELPAYGGRGRLSAIPTQTR